MSRKVRDMLTSDMFDVPKPVALNAGSLVCRAEIAGIMSDVLAECASEDIDRFEVAARMSRLLGREVSKYMLDAYTSESRQEHVPPLDTAIAFDMATGGVSLLKFYADKLGCRVMVGKEVLYTELGRIDQMKAELLKQEKAIKNTWRIHEKFLLMC